jgi:hypothetical protein
VTTYPHATARTYMDREDDTIFILQLARKGCRKLNAFAMPAEKRALDEPVALQVVPLHIRRAAREHFGLPATARPRS